MNLKSTYVAFGLAFLVFILQGSYALNHANESTSSIDTIPPVVETSEKRDNQSLDLSRRNNRWISSMIFASNDSFIISIEEQKYLLSLARTAISSFLTGKPLKKPEKDFLDAHPVLKNRRATFVTLEKYGHLRGCIGELLPQRSLYESVMDRAIKAASQDYRFKPVTQKKELNEITISISVLELPNRLDADSPEMILNTLKPGKDGVILVYKGNQSTFLPSVWDEIPDPQNFLSHLCQKQGAPANCWKDKNTIFYRYSTFSFSE